MEKKFEIIRKEMLSTTRIVCQQGYNIEVDNSIARSFNTNIDYPTFFCFALSEAEAIGKMMLSDFPYKKSNITRIYTNI